MREEERTNIAESVGAEDLELDAATAEKVRGGDAAPPLDPLSKIMQNAHDMKKSIIDNFRA